jgi:hypothetical protein
MKYDEYAEYQEFALHIDIDTSMCGFTEKDVPQYVANLMDSETDKDHKAVVRFIASPLGQPLIQPPPVSTESILGQDCRQQLHSAQLPDSVQSSGKHF